MVSTRRSAAAPAAPAAPPAALPATPARRRTRAAVAAAAADASPLQVLEDQRRGAPKSAAKKAASGKRKREVAQVAASPAPAPQEPDSRRAESVVPEAKDEEQGMFFTEMTAAPAASSSSSSSDWSGPEGQVALPKQPITHFFSSHRRQSEESPKEEASHSKRYLPYELASLRKEFYQLIEQNSQLERANSNLVAVSNSLRARIVYLEARLEIREPVANRQLRSDFDDLMYMAETGQGIVNGDILQGSESALALLKRIEDDARESRVGTAVRQPAPAPAANKPPLKSALSRKRAAPDATPAGFLSRSLSALKGFFSPSPIKAQAAPPAPTPSRAPPVDTITEVLSASPTPVGERSKAPPKKLKQTPMVRLLTKGVEPSDLNAAQEWAKHVIPTLKNDNNFNEKRRQLQTPVLMKDLDNIPSSKPWESGFGDPLGDLDDDDVVPVWAVYLDMLTKEEQPQLKKRKSIHASSMDAEDTPSLNDLFGSSGSTPKSANLFDSQGHSASDKDFHPRRSIEPSPMFKSNVPHQDGRNVFGESRLNEDTAKDRASQLEPLQMQTLKNTGPRHDPAHGSYGLDDSDEDDSSIVSEKSADTDPVWTQPPPPAPVPAHAPLPNGSAVDATAASTQQPVDEVERQRQKLMKHTPAKPSRLREAFVPSPSILSDAGNDSILISTPLQADSTSFTAMPSAEELPLEGQDWLALESLHKSTAWRSGNASTDWSEVALTYDSDEEGMSSE